MKKILMASLLLLAVIMAACGNKEIAIEPNSVTISTKPVDMSVYKGMSSTKHQFLEVDLYEAYRFIDEGGTGVFYLGYAKCPSCQEAVQHLNAVAEELEVNVYYINIDKEEYQIASNNEAYEEAVAKLSPILGKNNQGERSILTPDVFQVVNGRFGDYHVGLAKDIETLKKDYYRLLLPFAPKEQTK